MQIENFKIFADLVETKSFSKSAKLNGITQSAVSQQARAMDRDHQVIALAEFTQKEAGSAFSAADERSLRDFERPLGLLVEAWRRCGNSEPPVTRL